MQKETLRRLETMFSLHRSTRSQAEANDRQVDYENESNLEILSNNYLFNNKKMWP